LLIEYDEDEMYEEMPYIDDFSESVMIEEDDDFEYQAPVETVIDEESDH
jgi:hypothetical protein